MYLDFSQNEQHKNPINLETPELFPHCFISFFSSKEEDPCQDPHD
jgi:hypothetical protein